MALEFDASAEDIRVFLDEAEDQLQVMEEDILKLEKDPTRVELLQEIFRAAHTLKGSSATLGHRQMAEVTHAMENLLDKLRKGRLVATSRVIDTLFACLDVLKTFKEEIASGEEAGIDTSIVVARLAEVEASATLPAGEAAAGSMAALAPGADPGAPAAGVVLAPDVPALTPAEAERVKGAVRRGQKAWWLTLDLQPDAPMPAVRFFQAVLALGDVGSVVRSWPSQDEIEQDRVGTDLRVFLVTERPEDMLRHALLPVPEIRIAEIRPIPLGGDGDAPRAPAPAPGAPETPDDEARPGDQRPATARSRVGRTVRVDVDVLDRLMDLVGELVIDRTRLTQILTTLDVDREGDAQARELQATTAHIGRVATELQEEIMRARMLPVDNLFKKFPRMVRDLSLKAEKELEFSIQGEETELDRSVIEEIGDPLMHLLRNAIDHGVESPAERLRQGKPAAGAVVLAASHQENHIVISVRDDGRGIDPARVRRAAVSKGLLSEEAALRLSDAEAIRLVFAPGFSTAEQVSEVSGRGVGLDVVHKNIEKLNGSVEILTQMGKGTEFRIKLPLTLAIIRALLIQHQDTVYCVPLGSVMETIRWPRNQIQTVRGREVVVNRDVVIPLLRLEHVFDLPVAGTADPEELFVVVVNQFGRHLGLVVDQLIGEGEVVIKSLGKYVGEVPGVSGATLLGDGSVAIIMDVASLINMAVAQQQKGA